MTRIARSSSAPLTVSTDTPALPPRGEDRPASAPASPSSQRSFFERGKPQMPTARPRMTTFALGEEDGGGRMRNESRTQNARPEITTMAMGEEDGGFGACPADNDRPEITTMAMGEEDGGGFGQPLEEEPIQTERPKLTTMALFEEDGGAPSQTSTKTSSNNDGPRPLKVEDLES
jgi:hypothetical protein